MYAGKVYAQLYIHIKLSLAFSTLCLFTIPLKPEPSRDHSKSKPLTV